MTYYSKDVFLIKYWNEQLHINPIGVVRTIDLLISNKDAIRFYKRLGFEFVEYRTFGVDECEILRLERK